MNLIIFFSASASVPYVDVPGLGVAFGALSSEDSSIAVFNGIRYATAPIGERRWQSPTPAGPFVDALENATEYGPICWQTPPHHGYNGTYTMSEDCLFLNVAGPVAALNGSKALPVAVWIHGGSYVSGSSNLYRNFAMASAAKGELIVVTLNYRLNTIGFLGSPAIASAANGATGSAGNFGIEDQRAAMDWVKAHIAAFGGDAKRVTIFGESAGGNSVLNHLAQPKSKGLFQRAIIESGVYSSGGRTMLDATAQYNATLLAASCDASASAADQIACLRACNASSLVEYSSLPPLGAMWLPVIDGVSMTKAPTDLIAEVRAPRLHWRLIGVSACLPACGPQRMRCARCTPRSCFIRRVTLLTHARAPPRSRARTLSRAPRRTTPRSQSCSARIGTRWRTSTSTKGRRTT